MRAEVRTAAADDDAANHAAAAAAGFARALINLQLLPESSHTPFGVTIIAEGGALQGHGAVEDSFHGAMKVARRRQRKFSGRCQWMNASGKQRFIGIDITDSGKELLVQQPAFDGSSTAV